MEMWDDTERREIKYEDKVASEMFSCRLKRFLNVDHNFCFILNSTSLIRNQMVIKCFKTIMLLSPPVVVPRLVQIRSDSKS